MRFWICAGVTLSVTLGTVGSMIAGMLLNVALFLPRLCFFGGMVAVGVPIPEPSANLSCVSTVNEERGSDESTTGSKMERRTGGWCLKEEFEQRCVALTVDSGVVVVV